MKVLFAVNDENISTSIVKKYQKQYKEIISYKNVYFFNAILKELQMNKGYDRIVISEELEEFTSSSRSQRDRFIFDRLDNISDEAVTGEGTDIPIILICSDGRNKSEEFLTKLFGIGVYNAIIGDDRSTDEVCRLINKPRSKKEAKTYYNIAVDDVGYEKENENDVSEVEMQNILVHFKKIGNDEEKYVNSFNNIVSQYNDNQLKVIIAVLPPNVKEVLERKSSEYQRITGVVPKKDYNVRTSRNLYRNKLEKGTSEKFLDSSTNKPNKQVVVPSTMEKNLIKNVENNNKLNISELDDIEDIDEYDDIPTIDDITDNKEATPKRGRGRPKKLSYEEIEPEVPLKKRGRGRPRKTPLIDNIEEDVEEVSANNNSQSYNEEFYTDGIEQKLNDVTQSFLPGFEYENNGFEEESNDYEENYVQDNSVYETNVNESYNNYKTDYAISQNKENDNIVYDDTFDDAEFESLLSTGKKLVAFVGTSKNGTSFVVNNVAQIFANMGINTAILDVTQNKNAYYIYTKNDENLRATATASIQNLKNGIAQGLKEKSNLTIYTNIPIQNNEMNNVYPILDTIVKNHDLVLMDCDFETPVKYFEKAQEIYLVQSMDVLTIQPLTAFLRNLKNLNILDEGKIRIVLNKLLKLRGVTGKNIVGGMSNYNDPEMSFMVELFNRNTVKVVAKIPFDEDVYIRYLENLIECEMKINSYPKEFKQVLNSLAQEIYPIATNNKRGFNRNSKKDLSNKQYSSTFSSGMNNTLNNMRNKY